MQLLTMLTGYEIWKLALKIRNCSNISKYAISESQWQEKKKIVFANACLNLENMLVFLSL